MRAWVVLPGGRDTRFSASGEVLEGVLRVWDAGDVDALAATVAAKMRAAYRNPDALAAEAELEAPAVNSPRPTLAQLDPCARGWPRR